MKNMGKYLFLWLSVSLMLAHNVIPHHHHYGDEMTHQVCVEKNGHEHELPEIGELLFCHDHESENEAKCEECHFNVVTTDISKKVIQLYTSGFKNSIGNSIFNVHEYTTFYSPKHYIPNAIYLPIQRGPPLVS